jgi:dsDNA-binding SOS-regulon protein
MNLADSMKSVLKNKSHVFSEFWKDDLKIVLTEVQNDLSRMVKDGKETIQSLKKDGIKINLKEMAESGADALLIFKVLPGRIKDGFTYFKDDLVEELESLPGQKQKTIFSLKVIGAVISFTIGIIYNIKKGRSDFSIKGLKRMNAFTQFIVAELVFKISQLILLRFLNEIEKQVTEPDELKHIRYFRELLSDREKAEAENEVLSSAEPGDRAIEIVEDLKKYIMTGKRGIE